MKHICSKDVRDSYGCPHKTRGKCYYYSSDEPIPTELRGQVVVSGFMFRRDRPDLYFTKDSPGYIPILSSSLCEYRAGVKDATG